MKRSLNGIASCDLNAAIDATNFPKISNGHSTNGQNGTKYPPPKTGSVNGVHVPGISESIRTSITPGRNRFSCINGITET